MSLRSVKLNVYTFQDLCIFANGVSYFDPSMYSRSISIVGITSKKYVVYLHCLHCAV